MKKGGSLSHRGGKGKKGQKNERMGLIGAAAGTPRSLAVQHARERPFVKQKGQRIFKGRNCWLGACVGSRFLWAGE